MKKPIIVLGTASGVGKTTVALALCRYLHGEGVDVAPFKGFNMARHGAYLGGEDSVIGIGQAMQAEACGLAPTYLMNPVFVKSSAGGADLFINGKRHCMMTSGEDYTELMRSAACAAFDELSGRHEQIVIEGSGSCSEINLKDSDVGNLFMANYADADIILVADIDRGGVFASIVGTLGLMDSESRRRVKGLVINRLKGDPARFEEAAKRLEFITGVPVIGVIPWFEPGIMPEDCLDGDMKGREGILDVAAIRMPNMSSDSDIMPLWITPGVGVRPVHFPAELGSPDLIFIPGSYNSMDDNAHLQKNGLGGAIKAANERGSAVLAICGGLQILGVRLLNPEKLEGDITSADGIGLFDYETTFRSDCIARESGGIAHFGGRCIKASGFEHHCGHTGFAGCDYFTDYNNEGPTGAMDEERRIYATYMHGILESNDFAQSLVDSLLIKKGLEAGVVKVPCYNEYKQSRYDDICRHIAGRMNLGFLGHNTKNL